MIASNITVRFSSRPERVAFLADTEILPPGTTAFELAVDAVIRWNNTNWGGRTNPIMFASKHDLSEVCWKTLELADPDIIIAITPLPQQLIWEVDRRINPHSILLKDLSKSKHDHAPWFELQGIPTPPTAQNIARIQGRGLGARMTDEPLLIFEFAQDCDPLIERFVLRNFGGYDQWFEGKSAKVRRICGLEGMLDKIRTHVIPIADKASLATALEGLSGRLRAKDCRRPVPFCSPMQLCSSGLDPGWMHESEVYVVFVGDSPEVVSEHWNTVLWRGGWNRPHRRQLWLPRLLAEDAMVRESLRDWLRAESDWGSGRKSVELRSTDADLSLLQQWQTELRGGAFPVRVSTKTFAERAPSDLVEISRQVNSVRFSSELREDSESQRLALEGSTLECVAPTPGEFSMGDVGSGGWMLDVRIEHPERFKNNRLRQTWWHIPRVGNRLLLCQMFGPEARVNLSGHFSLRVVSRGRNWPPRFRVSVPDDVEVVKLLLSKGSDSSLDRDDLRRQISEQPELPVECRISEKGTYLARLVELFGSFWTLNDFLGRRFWRDLFRELSGLNSNADERLQGQIGKEIQRAIPTAKNLSEENLAAIAQNILKSVRGKLKPTTMTFNDCERLRREIAKSKFLHPRHYLFGPTIICHPGSADAEDDKVVSGEKPFRPINNSEMKLGLDKLLKREILRLGTPTHCPKCRITSWLPVDQLKMILSCSGCGFTFSLGIQPEWSYGLNSLVQTACGQGVLGVLQSLATIASQHHSFFSFSPSLEIFISGKSIPWHEIDLACIADGELIIGEVKETHLQEQDFLDMVEIGKVLKVQRIAFFLPIRCSRAQAPELREWLSNARAALQEYEIAVDLYELPEF